MSFYETNSEKDMACHVPTSPLFLIPMNDLLFATWIVLCFGAFFSAASNLFF